MEAIWIDNYLYFLGVIPISLLVYYAIEINKLLGICVQQSKIQLKKNNELPQYTQQLYSDAVAQLTPLGFKIQHCQVSQDVVANAVTHKWSLVLANPESRVFAEISPASTCLDMPGYEVNFWSLAPDGNALLTMNGRGHTILTEIPGVTIHDPQVLSLHQQYDTHIEERREWSSSTNYQQLFPDEYVKLQQKQMDGYLTNLSQEHAIVPKGNHQFRLSLLKCIKIANQYSKGERLARKLMNSRFKSKLKNTLTGTATKAIASAKYPVESDIQAFMRLSSSRMRYPAGLTAKIILLVTTLVIVYGWLGTPLSRNSALIILSAVLLHELGHILAMLAFRFRDFQILCVSVFGTATTVSEKNIANWKQVIIYLMGPLPGIAAGIALIISNQNIQLPWMYETSMVLLIINYLHLLPFMSLDGGRIIRLTVMERSPIGKILFPTLSGLAFAAGGHFMAEPVFWALAMVNFISIPFGLRESAILRELYSQIKKDPNIRDYYNLDWYNKLGRVFLSLKNDKFRKLNFAKKYNLVHALSGIIAQPKHSNAFGSFVFMVVYLGALLFVPSALLLTDLITLKTGNGTSVHLGHVAKTDLETRIQKATPLEQFTLLVNAANQSMQDNNMDGALKYLERAESLYGNINKDEPLAVLFQGYARYHVRRKEYMDAKQYITKTIALYKKPKTKNNYALANSYQLLSDVEFKLANNSKSEYELQKALSYAIKVEKPEQWHAITDIAGKLLDWYYIEQRQDDIQKLLSALTKKFKKREQPIKNYVTKFIYEEQGWIHAADNDEKAALEKFDQALELAEHNARLLNATHPDRKEETKLLLYKAAVYHKEGYDDFSRIQIKNAEAIAREESFNSLQQYIDQYKPQSIAIASKAKTQPRETLRWKLISDAYNKTNS